MLLFHNHLLEVLLCYLVLLFAIYFLHRLGEILPTASLRCRLCSTGLAAFCLQTGGRRDMLLVAAVIAFHVVE